MGKQHQFVVSGSSGFTNTPGNACQIASGATLVSSEATPPGANNQISDGLHTYDAAGDVTADATTGNQYLYDGEGRVCAVYNGAAPGMPLMTGYLYDADGTRVAKGTIASMSCDPTANGFQFTENYVLGPSGEELTMLDGSNNWRRTNVYAGGKLIGTYDLASNADGQSMPALHFHLEDALGTRRMQLSGMLASLGQPETDIQSLPFGDELTTFPDQYAPSTADDASPLHFTGKERDAESGNDYFGARYYASAMGRFLSPDWAGEPTAIPYGDLENPQSLNLYGYVNNNPLSNIDNDGHVPCGGTANVTIVVTPNGSSMSQSPDGCPGLSWLDEQFLNSLNNRNTRPTHPSAPQSGNINNQRFAEFMDACALPHSSGHCARTVREGMQAGGLSTDGRPGDAKNYGPWLLQHGYQTVPGASYFGGNEQVGDIAVFQPAPSHSQSGHIEMWDGHRWLSDFQQRGFSPYLGLAPSRLDYKIYRQGSQ